MTGPDSWLAARLEGAPEALATAVQRGGERQVDGALLRARAEALLAEAMTGAATGETALTLLAADALMTLACEWVSEHEPERLRD